MITKEEMLKLLEHFETVSVPEELEKFVEKIKLILAEIEIQEKSRKELEEIHKQMEELTKQKEA